MELKLFSLMTNMGQVLFLHLAYLKDVYLYIYIENTFRNTNIGIRRYADDCIWYRATSFMDGHILINNNGQEITKFSNNLKLFIEILESAMMTISQNQLPLPILPKPIAYHSLA